MLSLLLDVLSFFQDDKTQKRSADTTITKVGAIKKLLKKKYKFNQKIVFDEEGAVSFVWL